LEDWGVAAPGLLCEYSERDTEVTGAWLSSCVNIETNVGLKVLHIPRYPQDALAVVTRDGQGAVPSEKNI
jgi:hypothetical protein